MHVIVSRVIQSTARFGPCQSLRQEGSRWNLGAERARHESLEAAGFSCWRDGKLEGHAEEGYTKIDSELWSQVRRNVKVRTSAI